MKTKDKLNKKTIFYISIIGLFLLFGLLILSSNVKRKYVQYTEELKQKESFEKDEYCRNTYLSIIQEDLKKRWSDGTSAYHTNLIEVFYSPSMNECLFVYDLIFILSEVNTTEKIIARAVSGDPVLDVHSEQESELRDFTETLKNLKSLSY